MLQQDSLDVREEDAKVPQGIHRLRNELYQKRQESRWIHERRLG